MKQKAALLGLIFSLPTISLLAGPPTNPPPGKPNPPYNFDDANEDKDLVQVQVTYLQTLDSNCKPLLPPVSVSPGAGISVTLSFPGLESPSLTSTTDENSTATFWVPRGSDTPVTLLITATGVVKISGLGLIAASGENTMQAVMSNPIVPGCWVKMQGEPQLNSCHPPVDFNPPETPPPPPDKPPDQ